MNETTLNVTGMHCNSCKMLIMMELEDAGLADKIVKVELTDPNKQNGQVVFTQISREEKQKAIATIEGAGDYKVVAETN